MYIRPNRIPYRVHAFQIFLNRCASYFHLYGLCSPLQVFLHFALKHIPSFSFFIITACYVSRYPVVISSQHLANASARHLTFYVPKGYVDAADCPRSKPLSSIYFRKIHPFPNPLYVKGILAYDPVF